MSTSPGFGPLAASNAEPIRLAMQRLFLGGRLLPAGARLVVEHVFASAEPKPLEVIYSFPLPRDAALRSFRISGDGFEALSELKRTEDAVKAYERGIADGSLSALARQYGDGIVNLTVGNIRPGETVTVRLELLAGVELRDDGFRFRFPFTLAPCYHPQARASAQDGEGELELPAAEFGDVILPPFRKDAASLHEIGFDLAILHTTPVAEIGSPSHPVRVRQGASTAVALAPGRDVPDRDLVLDVRFQSTGVQALAGPSAGGRAFAAVIPSNAFGQARTAPRRVAILLDRSGSMEGEPIAQARKAIEACLAVLGEDDRFGIAAFDDRTETMHPALVPATRENRDKARAFLAGVGARGGTELAEGVAQAARMLEGSGDIVILTDGQVFGTEKILERARAAGVRLFCLGIGSASQDRFLALLARETGGVSRFVTPRERVDMAAVDLFAGMGRPIASSLAAGPRVQPAPPACVFAGAPVLLFGELAAGEDRFELTWEGGRMEIEVPSGDAATAETVRLLRGARLIADWESRYPGEEAAAPLEKRRQNRVAARLVELSEEYGLASREMSLVAVVKRAGDRPGELPETRIVPVGMPQDVAFESYFQTGAALTAPPPGAAASFAEPLLSLASCPPPQPRRVQGLKSRFRRMVESEDRPAFLRQPAPGLIDLAALLEPDGGMPGKDRAARSVAALLAFLSEGHTPVAGTFRAHAARLQQFLQLWKSASVEEQDLIGRALAAAAVGIAPEGPWLDLALAPRTGWKDVAGAYAAAGM